MTKEEITRVMKIREMIIKSMMKKSHIRKLMTNINKIIKIII